MQAGDVGSNRARLSCSNYKGWERKEDDSQPKPFLLDCQGKQVSNVSFLNGLQGNVTSAQFLHTSNDVIGCENLGNIVRWNIANQESWRMHSSKNRGNQTLRIAGMW